MAASGKKNMFNEATRVQMPAMVHLTRLGYTYFGKITEDMAGTVYDPDTNILINVFKEQFARLNPTHTGEAEQTLKTIRQELDNDDIGRSFYERLSSVSPVRLVDFENPKNNTYHFTAEFTCKRDQDEFRPDITLFVNGLPLVFVEVKKPNNHGGMVAESKRMNQKRFPNKKFRRFLNITQLMIFSNNMEYALKATCQTYGMGNDGNEYKIITQVFLYKFLNDKFGYEVKKVSPVLKNAEKWELVYAEMSEDDRLDIFDSLPSDIPLLNPEHLIANLWNQQAKGDFDLIFDSTMTDIADKNIDIFSTQTAQNTKIPLFEKLTQYVTDDTARAPFARALVDKLVNFSFEEAFEKHYDFFADIFEYLIKDYNTAGGGKYAEYYTPHAIATIMARLLVGNATDLHSIECYDPSAGTGTLLMALAHKIGEDKCTIFAQDISQRSNKMLKLNLILNSLVSSLDHAIQGDTLIAPYHKSDNGQELRTFDYVVSNPPFKMDFSDTRERIAAMPVRFWAGVPKVPAKKKESMAIYTLFIQHVLNSLKSTGKGAIVVPTGFVTAKSGVEKKILQHIVDEHIVYGCISMPSNVFANTGTNVSVLFFDNSRKTDKVVLIDASKLGEEYKDGNNQKRRLRDFEIDKIVDTFLNKEAVDDFSVAVTYDEIKEKKYSLAAGQYFDVKIEYVELSQDEFNARMSAYAEKLQEYFAEGDKLKTEIMEQLKKVKYE